MRMLNIRPFSGRLSDYFGFKLSDGGSVLSGETVCCMTCDKCFAYHGSNKPKSGHYTCIQLY